MNALTPSGAVDYARMLGSDLSQLDLYDHREHLAAISGSDLAEGIRLRARSLAAQGLARGDRVVLVAANSEPYLTTLLAVLLLGAVPCAVAPPPTPSRPESAGVQHLAAAVAVVDPKIVLAPSRIADTLPTMAVNVLSYTELPEAEPIWTPSRPPADPADLHHIQLTSGSTSAPKAVPLSHRNVAHNIAAIAGAIGATRGLDKVFSWLPMYHDMGFIQVLGALVYGLPLGLMSPLSYLRDPLSWLRNLSRHGSTISAGPPFAYQAAVDALRRISGAPDIDLSRWRHAFVGAEPIPYSTLRDFTDGFAALGLRTDTLVPCYGMAESVLATTLAPRTSLLGATGFGRVRIIERDGRPPLVSCGMPVDGLAVRVTDSSGAEAPAGTAGDIQVRGDSVMIGYRGPDGTTDDLADGWFDTGDRGLICGGELFVTGRTKEMVIVRGRNLPPHDIERAIERLPDVDAGSTAVFSVPGDGGREAVVAVLASRPAVTDTDGLRCSVATAVRQSFGFTLDDIVLVRRGTIPRTGSGKVQRFKVRERYLKDLTS